MKATLISILAFVHSIILIPSQIRQKYKDFTNPNKKQEKMFLSYVDDKIPPSLQIQNTYYDWLGFDETVFMHFTVNEEDFNKIIYENSYKDHFNKQDELPRTPLIEYKDSSPTFWLSDEKIQEYDLYECDPALQKDKIDPNTPRYVCNIHAKEENGIYDVYFAYWGL